MIQSTSPCEGFPAPVDFLKELWNGTLSFLGTENNLQSEQEHFSGKILLCWGGWFGSGCIKGSARLPEESICNLELEIYAVGMLTRNVWHGYLLLKLFIVLWEGLTRCSVWWKTTFSAYLRRHFTCSDFITLHVVRTGRGSPTQLLQQTSSCRSTTSATARLLWFGQFKNSFKQLIKPPTFIKYQCKHQQSWVGRSALYNTRSHRV